CTSKMYILLFFFFQAEDGIRDFHVTGVQTCALPICAQELRRRVGAPCESIIDDLGGAQSFGCRLIALGFASFAAARRSLCPQSLDRKSACRDTEYGSMVCECIKYDNIYRYEKAESII